MEARRNARKVAVQAIFQFFFSKEDINKILDEFCNYRIKEISNYKKKYDIKKSKQPLIFSRLAFRDKNKETIKQKNIDIQLIKSLTKDYEKWGPEWEEKAQSYAENISTKEIKSIRSEIRRIYGKL